MFCFVSFCVVKMSFPIYNITSCKFANSDTNKTSFKFLGDNGKNITNSNRFKNVLSCWRFFESFYNRLFFRYSLPFFRWYVVWYSHTEIYFLSENLSYLIEIRFSIRVQSHFMSRVSFDIPWKHKKASGFLIFSGGIERDHELEIG